MIGIDQFQSEFLGDEFDRSSESGVNTIRQISFGYRNYKGLFGQQTILHGPAATISISF